MTSLSSRDFFAEDLLNTIFSFESKSSARLISRENSRLEFKETFNLGSADDYAKAAAAFANAQGGYIVFGVRDAPRELVGLKTNYFETFDCAKFTQALNERFSPEIEWESRVHEVRGFRVGLLYFGESKNKPVVCTRDSKSLKQGTIFYRYRGQSQAIRYPELRRMLEDEKTRERDMWIRQMKRIADVGVGNVGILDLNSGQVSGAKGSFLVSEELLPKLQFLRSGQFVETDGAPALRLIGDLRVSEGPSLHATIKIPTTLRENEIVGAFLRRESVLSPIDYVKAVCFEQSHYYPIYFFIQQTNQSVEEIVNVLKGLPVRGINRDKVVSRLLMPQEGLAIGVLSGPGNAAATRRKLFDKLRERTIDSQDIWDEPIRFFEAMSHVDNKDFDGDYLFALLRDQVLPNLNKVSGLPLSAFRKAICRLDITWYRPLVG